MAEVREEGEIVSDDSVQDGSIREDSLSVRTTSPEYNAWKSGQEKSSYNSSRHERSIPDWQNSGLTRSELEYSSRKNNDGSSDQSTSSVLWLELRGRGMCGDLESANKAVQTSAPKGRGRKGPSSNGNTSVGCSNVQRHLNTSGLKGPQMIAVIEKHREYHLKKVRKELNKLDRINRLLVCTKENSEGTTSDSSSPSPPPLSIPPSSERKALKQIPPKGQVQEEKETEKKDPLTRDKFFAFMKPFMTNNANKDHDDKFDLFISKFNDLAAWIEDGDDEFLSWSKKKRKKTILEQLKENLPKEEEIPPVADKVPKPPKSPVAFYVPFAKIGRTGTDATNAYVKSSELQEAFMNRGSSIMPRIREREKIIRKMKEEREIRAEKKREWVRAYADNSRPIPMSLGPKKGLRVMSQREMRELTEKKYKKLPEVVEKKLQRIAEEEKKTNRLMRQVFTQKLRQHVLKGELNVRHCDSLIRH